MTQPNTNNQGRSNNMFVVVVATLAGIVTILGFLGVKVDRDPKPPTSPTPHIETPTPTPRVSPTPSPSPDQPVTLAGTWVGVMAVKLAPDESWECQLVVKADGTLKPHESFIVLYPNRMPVIITRGKLSGDEIVFFSEPPGQITQYKSESLKFTDSNHIYAEVVIHAFDRNGRPVRDYLGRDNPPEVSVILGSGEIKLGIV